MDSSVQSHESPCEPVEDIAKTIEVKWGRVSNLLMTQENIKKMLEQGNDTGSLNYFNYFIDKLKEVSPQIAHLNELDDLDLSILDIDKINEEYKIGNKDSSSIECKIAKTMKLAGATYLGYNFFLKPGKSIIIENK